MAKGIFNRVGVCAKRAEERYASEAPMSTVPFAASAIPVPEPVPAVVMEMLEYC